MKRLASLLLLPALVALVPLPAHAGSSTDAALGLGAFAVFNQIVRGETIFHGPGRPVIRERVVYVPAPPPPVVYTPPPVYYSPPPVAYAPAPVVYPHGYWHSRGGRWVWVARHHGHHGHHRHHGHHGHHGHRH
jgi:hypothetical protein